MINGKIFGILPQRHCYPSAFGMVGNMVLIGAMGFGAVFEARPIVRDLCRLVSEKTGIELDPQTVPAAAAS